MLDEMHKIYLTYVQSQQFLFTNPKGIKNGCMVKVLYSKLKSLW